MSRMRYSDFHDEFLRYLYRDSLNSEHYLNFRELADDNQIPYERGYLLAIHGDLKRPGYIEGPQTISENDPIVGRLTGHGLRYIESIYKDDLPEDLSSWRELRISSVGSEGGDVVPASNRLVTLDHNLPEYLRVKAGLEELREAARSVNDLPERDRIFQSLMAAETLWDSIELKVIQVKVGVIMAIEDAGRALAKTAKAVATALLVDTIKSLVKAKAGVDLDHI